MLDEAKHARERVLADLVRRRTLLQAQIEALRSGRDHLLDAYRIVKRTFLEATEALAQVEARAADERAATTAEPIDIARRSRPRSRRSTHRAPTTPGDGDTTVRSSSSRPSASRSSPSTTNMRWPTSIHCSPTPRRPRRRHAGDRGQCGTGHAHRWPASESEPVAMRRSQPRGRSATGMPRPTRRRSRWPTTPRSAAVAASEWRAAPGCRRSIRCSAPLVKRAKRRAQDDQNALLDAVRRHKGRPTAAQVLADPEARSSRRGPTWSATRSTRRTARAGSRRAASAPRPTPTTRDGSGRGSRSIRCATGSRAAIDYRRRGRHRRFGRAHRCPLSRMEEPVARASRLRDVLALAWSRGVYDAVARRRGAAVDPVRGRSLLPTATTTRSNRRSRASRSRPARRIPPAHPGLPVPARHPPNWCTHRRAPDRARPRATPRSRVGAHSIRRPMRVPSVEGVDVRAWHSRLADRRRDPRRRSAVERCAGSLASTPTTSGSKRSASRHTWRALIAAKAVPGADLLGHLLRAHVVEPHHRRSVGAAGTAAIGPRGRDHRALPRRRRAVRGAHPRRRVAAFFAIVMGSGVVVAVAGVDPVLALDQRSASRIRSSTRTSASTSSGCRSCSSSPGGRSPRCSSILIVTAVFHYLNGGIRLQSPFQRVTPQVKVHLSVILALMALTKTVQYYLARFGLTFSHRGVVDGATYTDVKAQLPALNLLMFISVAAAGLVHRQHLPPGLGVPDHRGRPVGLHLDRGRHDLSRRSSSGSRCSRTSTHASSRTSSATSRRRATAFGLDKIDDEAVQLRHGPHRRATSRSQRTSRRSTTRGSGIPTRSARSSSATSRSSSPSTVLRRRRRPVQHRRPDGTPDAQSRVRELDRDAPARATRGRTAPRVHARLRRRSRRRATTRHRRPAELPARRHPAAAAAISLDSTQPDVYFGEGLSGYSVRRQQGGRAGGQRATSSATDHHSTTGPAASRSSSLVRTARVRAALRRLQPRCLGPGHAARRASSTSATSGARADRGAVPASSTPIRTRSCLERPDRVGARRLHDDRTSTRTRSRSTRRCRRAAVSTPTSTTCATR